MVGASIRTSTVEAAIKQAVKQSLSDITRDPVLIQGELQALMQVAGTLGLDCYDGVKKAWSAYLGESETQSG